MQDQSIQQKQQLRTVFDVVRPFSEIRYDIDVARGVSAEQAEKNRLCMQKLDMTTEQFLRVCEVSAC